MKDLFYYSIFAVILYFVLIQVFDNFTLEQENFDPSLVPVSSIVTLAKVAQKLINGNGTLINPSNLQIGSSSSAPGNLTVTGTTSSKSISLPSATANNTFTLQNDTDNYIRLKDNGGGQLLAIGQDGSFYTKNNTLINSGNTTLSGTLNVAGNTTVNSLSTTNGSVSINNGTINLTSDGGGGLHFLKSGTISNPSYNGVQMGNLTVNGNESVSGNLNVIGSRTVSGSIAITGDTSITRDVSINGKLILNNTDISASFLSQINSLTNKITALQSQIKQFSNTSFKTGTTLIPGTLTRDYSGKFPTVPMQKVFQPYPSIKDTSVIFYAGDYSSLPAGTTYLAVWCSDMTVEPGNGFTFTARNAFPSYNFIVRWIVIGL